MKDLRSNDRRWTSNYYVVFDRDTNEAIGRVLNFSEGGLLLMSAEMIEVPSVLRCRLALPEALDGRTDIVFDAESRWGRRNEKSDWFETGFRITEISDADMAIFRKLFRGTSETDSCSQQDRAGHGSR